MTEGREQGNDIKEGVGRDVLEGLNVVVQCRTSDERELNMLRLILS